ncbi:diguanylate cyclase [Nakamurella sp. YIM 132087]|uniref:Diguanylate cyclase n=1 Tax=Nakamurella alba TaxID=2665158 RepID=A0A7K1FS59_9ACTN|nr:sensor domain-containing diguanylate cyclase [Nakamurella alba]MTD16975.1 diguanylate cyclase [Nakamurella alba]
MTPSERTELTPDAYRMLFEAVPMPVVLHDGNGRLTHANESFAQLVGRGRDELEQLAAADLIHPDDLAARELLARRLHDGEVERAQVVRRLLHADGRVITAQVTKAAVTIAGERFIAVFVEDTGEAVEEIARLRFAAEHDPLTGLLNRAGMTRQLVEAHAEGRTFEVAMIDVDGLKPINDTHGHPVGDRLLRQVARLLESTTPEGSAVARWSGDEFVVAALEEPPGTPSRLLRLVSTGLQTDIDLGIGMPHPLSVSVGVSRCGPDRGPDQALADADQAMYGVKHNRPGARPSLLPPARSPLAIDRLGLLTTRQAPRERSSGDHIPDQGGSPAADN